MTDPRDDRCWNEMVREMRRALHLAPLTEEEAAREYDEAPEIPMSEDQVAEYARIAASAIPREPSYNERTLDPKQEIEDEVGEVLGFYRNQGDVDPEVEEQMRRQREEALSDDDADNGDSKGEDGQDSEES